MEASHPLQKRLVLLLSRSLQSQCSLSPSSSPRTLGPRAPPSARKRIPLSSRAFSTSRQWCQEEPSPSKPAQKASHLPPVQTPQQALQSYTSAVQTIIDRHNLKYNMTSRQYEQLQGAVANAEVLLHAPGQLSSSFGPLLQSLRGEINPILERQFGTSDLQSIRQKAPSKPIASPSSEFLQNTRSSGPNQTAKESLDSTFGSPKPANPSGSSSPTSFPFDRVAEMYTSKLDESAKDTVADLFRPSTAPRRPRPDSSLKPSEILARSDRDMHKRMSLDTQFTQGHDLFMSSLPSGKDATRETLRLKPSLGRTVDVSYRYDLTRAFRSLEAMCSRNGVKRDQIAQRFHVRRGQKKKNLRINRWRKQFAQGFLAECARVRRMRKQGW